MTTSDATAPKEDAAAHHSMPPEPGPSLRRSRSLGEFVVPILLFVLAGIGGVVGVLLLPQREPLPNVGAFSISTSAATVPVSNILVAITPLSNSDTKYAMAVTVKFNVPNPQPSRISALLTLVFNTPAFATDCRQPSCISSPTGGGFGLSFDKADQSNSFTQTIFVDLTTRNLLFGDNGTNISGYLPGYPFPVAGSSNATVFVTYHFRDAQNYQWTSGNLPTTVAPYGVSWESKPWPETSTQISAVNIDAQSSDATKTFIAGSIIGIAGGALVGGLTELLHVHPQTRTISRRRRHKTTEGPHPRSDPSPVAIPTANGPEA
jgi:hypothetical protein